VALLNMREEIKGRAFTRHPGFDPGPANQTIDISQKSEREPKLSTCYPAAPGYFDGCLR